MLFAINGPGSIRLVGVSSDVGIKLAYTIGLILVLMALRWIARFLLRKLFTGARNDTLRFWSRQVINLVTTAVFIAGVLSIWFDQPSKLVTGLGLFSAGLAFALQQVILSIAGYLLILRGDIFTVGDRIEMGGVRGDVIGLGFIRTTILEMGRSPGEDEGNGSWVRSRQYTGRIVTVSNGSLFTEPVYNYTRDFPFLWEEIMVPIPYTDDRRAAEQILMDAAQRHTVDIDRVNAEVLQRMQRRYIMPATDLEPAVFLRMTDNWIELTVRFAVPATGIRKIKSDMTREILDAFEAKGITVASATYDIVGLPPVRLQQPPPSETHA